MATMNEIPGYSIAPWLSIRDGEAALAFYQAAFGATIGYRLEGGDPDAGVVARLSVHGAEFWIGGADPGEPASSAVGGGTVRMILTVPDPDLVFGRAVAAGAQVVFAVSEAHGWRLGRLVDPFGLHWEIGRQL
jgi:PhnB protein